MRVQLAWEGKMHFVGRGETSGHAVSIDAAPEVGGENRGARPMELLLHGLGGCTAIDIVSILKKMRLSFDAFSLDIEAERAAEHPRRFTRIHLHYRLQGTDLPPEKVRRAIRLSMDKYCSAAASLNAALTATFEINGERFSADAPSVEA
ncbi:OsmC family protein [Hydrogenibacillus schlegelii]|uniref:OsmC family protein n=1 Tax=Hydrogenibacillus schlegelii TaxID=1484 RepID=A0A132NBW0_HYDSH|nr:MULTISPECIES: OsmC family protein [Hydrogenibacillus]KWX07584.1 peroxiredoxin [Hydrogenibacillus schlegelii]MBT9283063.1 OsmC family protein [Hydrogenibacillus schlegelii]OAR04416.1 peroxiredoxin [Hydrogenibacillus schlegelii]PTQ52816.1 MAG: OsmC/Ohr family protein [Hydrogenibacillus schlegelii]QZA33162.1 OsmC family protein [Hydrogenibacillus sp. N12]